MGFSVSPAVQTATCVTQDDWNAWVGVIRRSVPGHVRVHAEFESAANECLARALKAFDSERGVPFAAFLNKFARRRMGSLIARQSSRMSLVSYGLVGDDRVGIERPSLEATQAFEEVDARSSLGRLLHGLTATEKQVALSLAYGMRPIEIAEARGVRKQAVSSAVRRIRSKAVNALGESEPIAVAS